MTKDFQKMNIPRLPVFTTEEGIKTIKNFLSKLTEWKKLDDLIPDSFQKGSKSAIKQAIRRVRNKYAIRGKGGPLGKFLFHRHPIPIDFRIIGQYAQTNSSILDVGCGSGNYVNDLYEIGFKHAEGIDPFFENDIQRGSFTRVRKLFVEDVEEQYDVVISHHSLEHVSDPLNTLLGMKSCLKDEGTLIVTWPCDR